MRNIRGVPGVENETIVKPGFENHQLKWTVSTSTADDLCRILVRRVHEVCNLPARWPRQISCKHKSQTFSSDEVTPIGSTVLSRTVQPTRNELEFVR